MDEDQAWGEGERRVGERRAAADRRKPLSVIELVGQAARDAAQEVAAIHRRRLVVQSGLAAFLAALLVMIPLVLYTNSERTHDSSRNAEYNCRAVGIVADSIADFISSDAKLRYQQQHYAQRAAVLQAFGKVIDKRVLTQIASSSDKLDTQTQGYWTNTLIPRLSGLARVNCAAAIR